MEAKWSEVWSCCVQLWYSIAVYSIVSVKLCPVGGVMFGIVKVVWGVVLLSKGIVRCCNAWVW